MKKGIRLNGLDQERQALRLLCSNLIRPQTRMELCELLDPALFEELIHRVVFEEIRASGPLAAARLREMLPARVTNRGFPDFELTDLLGKGTATEAEIEELFESILQMVKQLHADNHELEN